jgi:UDP-glucuronate 4-epimerase
MRYLITGSAGFIGFHLSRRLLAEGHSVVGYDALTPYYDVRLKHARHAILQQYTGFRPIIGRLEDMDALRRAADVAEPEVIVHLAAQAGVRYSIDHPRQYTESNVLGSFNVLELSRGIKPRHLLLASTSSVYGANDVMPFQETSPTDHPLSFYASTKRAMEAMSHSYAHLFGLAVTCFRFFTVYGPWGRPDMALFKFVDAILNDRAIDVHGHGNMTRDFTYIDDLVEAIVRLADQIPQKDKPVTGGVVSDTLSPAAPWRIVNIGGGEPISLLPFIDTVERCLGKTAIRNMVPIQPGELPATYADHRLLEALTDYRPQTSVETGVSRFVEWYVNEYCALTMNEAAYA